jgi:hypothetical protein
MPAAMLREWVNELAMRAPPLLARVRSQSRALAPWQGEVVDVDRFWADAWREMTIRQQKLARRLMLAHAHWSVDQEQGLIHFERQDGATLSAPVQIIGAWNPETHAFTWAWDHPSVQTRLRADAERTRWFGEKHGLPELTDRSLVVTEQEAWRLTAVAMKVNAAQGVYRGPTDGPIVFMTLRDLKVQF